MFIPDKSLDLMPSYINTNWEDVYFQTEDGVKINGWFSPANPENPTVLFLHGNAGNIGDRVWFLQFLNNLGLSCFIIDYRGYGKSTGKPSEDGINQDAIAAYEYLTQKRNIPGDMIILWGTSLGGAPATYIASKKKCGALILFSSFTNASDMASIVMPFAPFLKSFMKVKYDNIGRLREINIPVFIIHAKNDSITPHWMGEKLYSTANEPKKFLSLSYSDHAIISEEDYRILGRTVLEFAKSLEKKEPKEKKQH